MLFRSTDLLNDFERLTKGLNFGPEFDKTVDDLEILMDATEGLTLETRLPSGVPPDEISVAVRPS